MVSAHPPSGDTVFAEAHLLLRRCRSVDADVISIAEGWDHEIDTGRILLAKFGLDRSAHIAILLPRWRLVERI